MMAKWHQTPGLVIHERIEMKNKLLAATTAFEEFEKKQSILKNRNSKHTNMQNSFKEMKEALKEKNWTKFNIAEENFSAATQINRFKKKVQTKTAKSYQEKLTAFKEKAVGNRTTNTRVIIAQTTGNGGVQI